MEYRYRNFDSRGTIRIAGDKVASDVARGFSKWSFETPLKQIYPDPIRSWSFPSTFWVCALVGVGGLLVGIWQLVNPADAPDPHWVTYVVLVLSLGAGVLAFYVGREEWIVFPTECDDIWIRFTRSGPDRKRFDEFTAELSNRISQARAAKDQ